MFVYKVEIPFHLCNNFKQQVDFITAQRSYDSAVLVIAIISLSVWPSVTLVLCDETKERTADNLMKKCSVIANRKSTTRFPMSL